MTDKADIARDEAERAITCACMQDRAALVLAAERLTPEHFKSAFYGGIYGALIELQQKGGGFGPADVIEYLERNKIQVAIDSNDILRAAADMGYVSPFEWESDIDLLVRRQKQDDFTKAVRKTLVSLEGGYVESLEDFEMHLAFLESEYRRGLVVGSDLIEHTDCLARAAGEPLVERGLLTGYLDIDRHIDLRPGQIMTIYGDTASKKTTLVMNFVSRWARDKKIAVYNYEQKPIEIARMVADCDKLKAIPKGNLWYHPTPPPIEALPSQVRARKLKYGLDGIVLDYIQTIPAKTRNLAEDENNLVRFIMRSMRDLAQQESIWIVIIAQMRKSQTDTMEHQLNPSLDKMRGSGEIKMASSIILSVVLPWKCEVPAIDNMTTENLMHVRIKKNRDCLTGNPGEEKVIKLVHSPNNRLITSLDYSDIFMPRGGTKD